jgi:hypothetical protein
LSKYKQYSPESLLARLSKRYHFSNPNTTEIIFTLLFLGVITRLLAIMGRDGKY